MDLRTKITEALESCRSLIPVHQAAAVMGVLEAEQKHARADILYAERAQLEARVRALEEENQRLRADLGTAVRFEVPTPRGTIEVWHQDNDIPNGWGEWWITTPWRRLKSGYIENAIGRDVALARSRQIAEEET